jgi:hypothetical protein
MLTLIGANNEGKSNILRALRLALTAMEDIRLFTVRGNNMRVRQSTLRREDSDIYYDWAKDFPIDLQSKEKLKDKATRIKLTFSLNDEEVEEFTQKFNLKVNGSIPVELVFSKDLLEVDIIKQGPGKAAFQNQRAEISRFLSERLRFVYIPAVRTSDIAVNIINRITSQRLRRASGEVLSKVAAELSAVESSVFQEIEAELKETLNSYITEVRAVRISSPYRPGLLPEGRNYNVMIDDGSETELSSKGDGVQSLVAMALLQSRGGPSSGAAATIFAIEEPEAHLNSEAIYKLRKAIVLGAQSNQVILTTHSPIFAFSGRLSSNIIVKKSVAEPARNMQEIRDALGVKVPENLTSAGLILLCEGKTDGEILRKYLCADATIADHLDSGFLKIEELRGVTQLPISARMFSALSCEVVAFIDGDAEAKDAASKAVAQSFISEDRVVLCADGKRAQVEFEDLMNEADLQEILSAFSLTIDDQFLNAPAKFSIRIKNLADRTGVLWSDAKLLELKIALQTGVCSMAALPLKDAGKAVLDKLRRTIVDALI